MGDDSSTQIPDEALVEDVERVIDDLGHVPTIAEYDDRGTYSPYTIIDRLGDGSWHEALRTLGYKPTSHAGRALPDAALRADLERVIDELGRPPKWGEYDEHGKYSAVTVAGRLGDGAWADTIRAVDHEPQGRSHIPESDLHGDLERVIDALGRSPTLEEYTTQGQYAGQTLARRFGDGSWRDALRALGHEPHGPEQQLSEADLRSDLERVANSLGEPPTSTEYKEHGEYGVATVSRRLGDGSWSDAMQTLEYSRSAE